MMKIRDANSKDFEQIMKIYKYAQDYMIQSGNPTQWGHFYPDEELIRSDIHQNACKVIYDENGIHGVCALFEGADPTYEHIEDGNWLNDEPYLTIHRLAGNGYRDALVAPDWLGAKFDTLNKIDHEFIMRNSWQGKKFEA